MLRDDKFMKRLLLTLVFSFHATAFAGYHCQEAFGYLNNAYKGHKEIVGIAQKGASNLLNHTDKLGTFLNGKANTVLDKIFYSTTFNHIQESSTILYKWEYDSHSSYRNNFTYNIDMVSACLEMLNLPELSACKELAAKYRNTGKGTFDDMYKLKNIFFENLKTIHLSKIDFMNNNFDHKVPANFGMEYKFFANNFKQTNTRLKDYASKIALEITQFDAKLKACLSY